MALTIEKIINIASGRTFEGDALTEDLVKHCKSQPEKFHFVYKGLPLFAPVEVIGDDANLTVPTGEAVLSHEQLKGMSVPALKQLCKDRKVSFPGNAGLDFLVEVLIKSQELTLAPPLPVAGDPVAGSAGAE